MNFISPGGIEEAVAEVVEVEGGPVVGGSKGVMKLLSPGTITNGIFCTSFSTINSIHCNTCPREKRVELNTNKNLADKGWLVVIPINTASPDGMGWGCGRRSGCGSRGATESPHEIRPLLTHVRSS